jgi:hypothetical protein
MTLSTMSMSGEVVLCVSALSRYSRNSAKLHRILEFLLAHQATILTTNYLIRPGDVWVRRGELVKPVSADPFAGFAQTRGLVGAHRKLAENVTAQLLWGRGDGHRSMASQCRAVRLHSTRARRRTGGRQRRRGGLAGVSTVPSDPDRRPDNRTGADVDGFIVQWGRYSWHAGRLCVSFTRQLAVPSDCNCVDIHEQPDLWQVDLTLVFDDAPGLAVLDNSHESDTGFYFEPAGSRRDAAIAEAAQYPQLQAALHATPRHSVLSQHSHRPSRSGCSRSRARSSRVTVGSGHSHE